jgi:uncharacterized MAPEG superfamily protein
VTGVQTCALPIFSGYGALIYFLARIVYLPLYAFGVPVARSVVWLFSLLGLGMVLAAMVV